MRYLDETINDWNFVYKCANISISDKSCITGIVISVLTVIPLFLNVYAFAKMTMLYKKINFENGIIWVTDIEIFIL